MKNSPLSNLHRVFCLALLCAGAAVSAEPKPRETEAAAEALRREQRGEWPGAGYQWEQAMSQAEKAGDLDRAIAHGERALAAWQHEGDAMGLDRQAFALGVMCKLDLSQGRLTRGRERNLAALRIITRRIAGVSGWQPEPGKTPPAGVPVDLLEAWARTQNDTASWLDAQGRTVEAVELLTRAEISMRAASPGGRATGFYHRKLLTNRAGFRKFLGFQELAIADLRQLADTRLEGVNAEFSGAFNLPYFSSQFYGPKPEYLDAARNILRSLEAADRRPRDLRRLLAKMAFGYRETGAEVRDLEEVIAEAQQAGEELEAIYAQRDLAILNSDAGRRKGVEESLLKALAELRRRGVKRGEPTLYREYGEFLIAEGRVAEGLRMSREAVRLTRAFGWTQHLPRLLVQVATAQARLGDLAGLTQTLAELDALLSGGKLVPARVFLAHCARARVLSFLGRRDEASAAVAQAIAYADRVGLNEYQRFALSWTKDVEPAAGANPLVKEQAPESAVDLQPVSIIATAASGETALARFRLSNSGAQMAAGTLDVEGRAVSIRLNDAAGIATVLVGAAEENAPGQVPVRIGAGEDIVIKVEATVGAGNAGVRLVWKSGATTASAVCHVRPASTAADDEPGATVANTSLAWENPFYAVPLFHPFRISGGPRNFRVQPSRRCRVEVCDAFTGALLAVDADGDGAFQSAGDSVAADVDGDSFPELPADAATGRGEIEIFIFPLAGAVPATMDTRVEVQTKTAAGWETVAHDVLKAPRR